MPRSAGRANARTGWPFNFAPVRPIHGGMADVAVDDRAPEPGRRPVGSRPPAAVAGAHEDRVVTAELELGQYIPLHYHFNMLADETRTGAFARAIDAVVPPGGSVVELGCGTGILSFLAARRAARVWAVERNPRLVEAARRLLAENGAARVDVVAADAREWLPPEPVDVVVCEMLHVGLLREQQLQVIDAFARGYLAEHGPPLPRLLPEAVVQAVQPVQQDYDFHGYQAAVPFFQDARTAQPRTIPLGEPVVYHALLYERSRSPHISWSGSVAIEESGTANALRVLTKNLLAMLPRERRSIDWLMNYLVVPLAEPLTVTAGDALEIAFSYDAGGPLEQLTPAVRLTRRTVDSG